MDKKIGVYMCSGCGIGESLDLNALEKAAAGACKESLCRRHECMCGQDGCGLIRSDMEKEGINTIVIAACSPRECTDRFAFPSAEIVERVNLREHVVWTHTPKDEDTQAMAEDYLVMGIVKALKSERLVPYIAENLSSKILVIGGGLTGITAAREAANTGFEVVLVEKEKELGGWVRGQRRQVPLQPPYTTTVEPDIAQRISEVAQCKNVEILTGSTIEKISGQPGCFDVRASDGQASKEFRVGSIIIATGANEYAPSAIEKLGYGAFANVVTSSQFEKMAREAALIRPSDGKPVSSVAFIQCAGSRDRDHLPYCSAECCLNSLKQAQYVREMAPEAPIYILYKDIRTPGQYENFYRTVQEDTGVYFSKGEIRAMRENEFNDLIVTIENTLLGETIEIQVHMVVLAMGMVTSAKDGGILNLTYRQGKELPELKYGFPDSHFICFPYETRRTGIYAAGVVRQPMDPATAIEDATGAALKAIQCIVNLREGRAVHPRSGDRSYPEITFDRCTSCKRCTEECPFGAYDENEKGTPLPNPNRCRRCGICLGACPERVINFKDYSIAMITAMVKSISIPEDDDKPRVLALMCENDAYPALDLVGHKRIAYSPFIRVLPVRCIGSVSAIFTNQALSQGFDGLLMIGCKSGEDYQCHFIKGSEILNTRGENLQDVMKKLALEPERLHPVEIAIDEYDKIPQIIETFMKTIEEVGPNPFKGL